ncbi:hypothetical protein ACFL2D_02420 [Patescibacteria group bacterium]
MDQGFRGEKASAQELEQFKQYSSYSDLIEHEFPSDEKLEEEEKNKREREYVRLNRAAYVERSPRIQRLESLVLTDHLKELPEFDELLRLLEDKSEETEEIIDRIKRMREALFSSHAFKISRVEAAETDHGRKKAWKNIAEWRMEGKYFRPESVEQPEYSEEGKEIEHLYHWIPDRIAPIVTSEGLVPGFISDQRPKFFVYTSLERNDFWPRTIAKRLKQFESESFVELEIDYDDSMEAYMWMPYYEVWPDQRRYAPAYPGTILSSRAVPLRRQVAELLLSDKDLRAEDHPDEDSYFSPLLNREIPHFANTSISSWETSEVLLNFVPPEKIRIIGRKTVPKES